VSAPRTRRYSRDGRAPDIDDLVEAALDLVEVVGDVRGEIGVQAVVALDDAVLLVAE